MKSSRIGKIPRELLNHLKEVIKFHKKFYKKWELLNKYYNKKWGMNYGISQGIIVKTKWSHVKRLYRGDEITHTTE